MLADVNMQVFCPRCGRIMWNGSTLLVISCINESCSLNGKKFKFPQIELEEVKEGGT
jgi:hypothetical protein